MTQCEKVMNYIEKYGSISTWEAFRDLGVTRLASRIHDLKNEGVQFERTKEYAKNRDGDKVHYIRYTLID